MESKEAKFIDIIEECYLYQHTNRPTRCRGDDMPSQLDIIFTNELEMASDVQHMAPLGESDHQMLKFNFNCYAEYTGTQQRFNYNRGDYEDARQELQEVPITAKGSVQQMWDTIKDRVIGLRNGHVPTIQTGGRKWKSNYPHDKEVLDLIREKVRYHRFWVAIQHSLEGLSARQSYNQARNKVRKRTRQLRKQYELNIANQSMSKPKVFWRFARDRLKTKIGVAQLLCNPDDPGTLRHSDEEKADILQSQFCSVFTREPERLERLVITHEWVLKALMKTNITKSCGPDELHPRMLKELAVELAAPMTKLFNQSLFLGEVPEEWKMVNVSPIFKKVSRKVAANYRPVSLTLISCKIMGAAVRETILTHLKRNSILSTRQFGFLGGRSTILQLLTLLDKCVDAISRGNVTDVVYLDFQKAFDTVPHKRLQAYGISGVILNWINAFLDGRTRRVIVNGIASRKEAVLSGVSQGSVLGPLLFVLYITG